LTSIWNCTGEPRKQALNNQAKECQDCNEDEAEKKHALANGFHSQYQSGEHQQSDRYGVMEALHAIFHAAQISLLNLAPMAGISARSFALTGIAGCCRRSIDSDTPRGIRKDWK